ncbi:hypothetical protein BH10PSE10_BH10PSE10_25510 [soil metagenome]
MRLQPILSASSGEGFLSSLSPCGRGKEADRLQRATAPSRKPGMGVARSLQNWLDSHGLGTIVAAVLGIIVLLAVILVVGGYWFVTPR